MTTPNPLVTLTSRTPFLPKRTWRHFRPLLLELESREAAGSLLNPLMPDPFLGLIDWPYVGAITPQAEAVPEPAGRWLTKHDTWLEPQLLASTPTQERVTFESPSRDITITARPAFEPEVFGETLRPAIQVQGTTSASVGRGVSVASGHATIAPVVSNTIPALRLASDGASLPAISPATVNELDSQSEIPNKAPVAVNDSITVYEDGSVLFDPTANDTDADEDDVLWVKSVQGETSYGRTSWEDGKIRYIPNPNYENTTGKPYFMPDTFSYEVTDGLATATGTVSVTVTAVNDAPVAANDVMIFTNYYYGTPAGKSGEMTYEVDSSFYPGLISNDKDYDSFTGVTVATKDFTGTAGVVTVTSDGKVTWSGLKSYVDETSFKYRAADNLGMLSDWVTVKLICNPTNAPVDSVSAVQDEVTVGDGPDDWNVLANDKGAFVVLTQQPSSGRLSMFDFDGDLQYLSNATRSSESVNYVVFSGNGRGRSTGTAAFNSVNMTIHHGQNGKSVSELNERVGVVGGTALIPVIAPTGAFTVANLNDSDVNNVEDGKADQRNIVPKAEFPGSGEVDLMKLELQFPASDFFGPTQLRLSVGPGKISGAGAEDRNVVRIWRTPTKGDVLTPEPEPLLASEDGYLKWKDFAAATNPLGLPILPTTVWVEVVHPSASVGDVQVYLETRDGPESWKVRDTVSMTAIWVKNAPTVSGWPQGYFHNTPQQTWPAEADNPEMKKRFDEHAQGFGVNPLYTLQKGKPPNDPPTERMQNAELAKFEMYPTGLTRVSVLGIVHVDTSRSYSNYAQFVLLTGPMDPTEVKFPAWVDQANDDAKHYRDEDNNLLYLQNGVAAATDYVFAIDGPGMGKWIGRAHPTVAVTEENGNDVYEFTNRMNFYDFVRVQFGSPFANVSTLLGSRASVHFKWSSMTHLRATFLPDAKFATMARFKVDGVTTENRIEPDHIDITVAGGGVV